jgi:4-hydroxy-tetrahydrodipicolinate reductase
MDRKLRVVQYGCGKMSRYFLRYVQEKGAEVVGALDANPDVIGTDVGLIYGSEPIGVLVTDVADVDRLLRDVRPDVAIVATLSTVPDIEEMFANCARNGVSAISIAEEAVYPWNSSPQHTARLDALAKAHGVTLSGSGYPDMYWGVLIDTVAGSMHKLTKIKGVSSYNIEHYGMALAVGHGAGLPVAEFEAELGKYNDLSSDEQAALMASGEIAPSYMWNQNGWLCARLGLTPISQVQRCVPTFHDEDLDSSTLGKIVPAGVPTGMSAIVVTETAEGITLETECVGKVYGPDDYDRNDWTFHGEPETTIKVDTPPTVQLTCANAVNRIPALLNAAPGYVSSNELPNNRYLVKPLHEYVTWSGKK